LLGILVIRAMRYALEAFQPGSERLSNAWADPEIGIALVRMHERLDHPWTVAGLAKEVGVCRSNFAARFLLAVGKPPLKYLRDLRMQRASILLRERARSLKEIAALTGFRTRSSFCVAFRRWSGKSPREYRCFRGGAS
jgi:transcriptional regulator GlxA family with amidase domain